ncbi:MAG: pyrroline-5-carboxylate reductase [Chthoniobacterales bacterium]
MGAGHLAGSVIRGLLRVKFCAPDEIIASQPIDELREELQRETGIRVVSGNEEVVRSAAIILLGVKPTIVLPVIKEIAPHISNKLVISLAGGTRLASMEPLADARFMRVMTNTPSAIGRAATAFAAGSRTNEADIASVTEIFSAIGVVVKIDEEHIDAVTALAGSGPAFVYTVIEALAEGGRRVGLPNEMSLKLATQMVLGAAQLAAESNASPEELRRAVATPGGTTAAGLAAMEKHGTNAGLIAAVEAATARGREMAQETQR